MSAARWLLGGAMLLAALAARAGEPEAARPLFTVLFTGEVHGALLPCDCPLQPLGGVARRATAIKRYRERGPVLLVDAGGWQAGGIYDEDSDGDPQRDELRTRLMARAMALMQYDVIAGGADEPALREGYEATSLLWPMDKFAWRPLPLPPPARGGENNAEPTAPASGGRKNGTAGQASSGTTPAGGGDNTACALITQWAADKSARLWARKGAATGDAQGEALVVGLSRLGETESTEAAGKLLSEFLVINAGRRTSQRVWWRSGKATLANFDYQAQRLGVAEVFPAPPGSPVQFDIRVRQEILTPDVPDDPEVAALLAPHMASLKKKGKQRVDIEYWTMPDCPACAQARPEIEKLAADLGSRATVSVHFVLYKDDDGKLRSLRGGREHDEAAVQAVVQRHYPGRIWDWLNWRAAHPSAPWQDGARELGLLAARIRGALATGEAVQLLEADYALSLQRRVNGAPTLVIANRLYDDQLDRLHVLRSVCGLLDDPKPGACKDVPACFHDAQCRKRGYIGRCIDPGKPTARCDTSRPAVKVSATVVADRECIYSNHERIMEVLVADLPGIEYRVLDMAVPEAQELMRKAAVARLPAYFVDPIARTEVGFGEGIGRMLRDDRASGMLVLDGAAAVGAHRVLNRPRMKGRVDLFVAPLSKFGQEALESALEFKQTAGAQAPELVLHNVLYWTKAKPSPYPLPQGEGGETATRPPEKGEGEKGKRELAATNGLAEIEEAARALAVAKLAPSKLHTYLLERGKRRGSSYWDAPLKAAGLDPAAVRALADPPAAEIAQALYADADLLKSLDAAGEIVLLAENCELIPVRSRRDLRDVLERVGPPR